MGGIKVDVNSKTTVDNLYAIGECASTGLHGANRLASNSLLECVVFALDLANTIENNIQNPPNKNDLAVKTAIENYIDLDVAYEAEELIEVLFNELKSTMTTNVGIVRTHETLQKALFDIKTIQSKLKAANFSFNFEKYELKNALIVAQLIVKAALNREVSIGAHYRADDRNARIKETKGIEVNDKILAK